MKLGQDVQVTKIHTEVKSQGH